MDEVTYVKTRLRQEQWEKLIIDCQNSGLKIDDWCEKNQISRHAYYYWLRKIRKKTCESLVPTIPKQNSSVVFAKVEMQAHQTTTATAITVHLPAATIEVREGTSLQAIEAVLTALKNIC
ncbi:MAG: IS66 family insertion sequence element accessory protein TnpB [Crenarchaeota archaeon]|nr:IS66 family insertion sequence element accessory protein TnpB [Thermoproteota archaeon]